MAEFGAKYPCFKPNGAASGIVLGKLAAANLTVNLASGELYADDSLAEQLSEFSSGSLAMVFLIDQQIKLKRMAAYFDQV